MTEELRQFCLENLDDLKLKDAGFDIDKAIQYAIENDIHLTTKTINPKAFEDWLKR